MIPLISEAKRLFDAGQLPQAEAVCRQLLEQTPDNLDAIHLLAAVHARRGRFDEALPLFAAFNARQPTAESLANESVALRSVGRFAEAEKLCRRALKTDPAFVRAYQYLAELRRYPDAEELVPEVRRVLANRGLSMADQAHLHFAAGKVLDDAGRYEEAFYHIQLANACHTVTVDPNRLLGHFHRKIEFFSAATIERLNGQGNTVEQPIFVVGMPRSGTSLVEQILASHPEVFGAGELPDIPSISRALANYSQPKTEYPECLTKLTVNLAAVAQGYLNRVKTLDDAHPRFVDKLPGNFEHLGLILLMFPNARIIHCRRDPLDTCLSCYFQNFVSGHDYSFSLVHLGIYYRLYERLMDHWHRVFPGRICEVAYERLVARPEDETRRLVDHAKLAWDDVCLAPHRTQRSVATASSWQVRQPIHSRSVGRWRNYADYLGPLRLALSRESWTV